MYTSERIRKRLAAGEILFGLAHHYPSTAVLESMGAGWDFVWVDAQHGQHSYDSALESVRVAQGMGLDTLLRVDSRDRDLLGKYADTKGPGLAFVPLGFARMKRVALRVVALDVPVQDVITRDNISAKVNAVL